MNNVKSIFILAAMGVCLIGTNSCKGKSEQSGEPAAEKMETRAKVEATLLINRFPRSKNWSMENGN